MKRLTLALVVLLALARDSSAVWTSGGPFPASAIPGIVAANTVLADTGAFAADQGIRFTIQCSCYLTVAAACSAVVEHLDSTLATRTDPASGGSHNYAIFVIGTIGGNFQESMPARPVDMFAGDRLRVRLTNGITGVAWCSILYE